MNLNKLKLSIALTTFFIGAEAAAATPNVDAGSLLRQTEKQLSTPTKKSTKHRHKAAPPPVAPKPAEATVQVRGFKFVGNTLLSVEQLNSSLTSFIDRPLTLLQLREAADVVATQYREAGWTVRAFLPKQEIAGGIVTLQIVEAVFGGASVQGNPPERISGARLVEMAEANLIKGQPLHASEIDRVLLLLDDLPGVNVAGNLVEGQRDGETELAISALDDALVNGNISVDNQGARSTGSDRLNVNLIFNSPFGFGDALALNGLKTQGTDYQRLGYSVPVGNYGLRAGLHASNLNYRVITDDFASLNPSGIASTRGWDISYPLLRSQLQNVNVVLSYDDKKFDNTSNSTTTSYVIKVYNASLSANQVDSWGGGGATNGNITLSAGEKSTESGYTKLSLSLSRLQSLNESLSLYAAANAQVSNRNLDSSEKMYLGGSNGVRAFPASEAGGSEGNTLTLELRQRVDNNINLTGFYDYGRIKVNHDNSIASPANPNDYVLQGYGVSVAWQAAQGLEFKATLAQRLGINPAAQASGNDGDGTKKMTRIWLSTGMSF
jgi:hemolysin activation/secretion protein